MRRRLILAAVAVTTTIVLAFCVPLARLVRDIARDQAIGAAERDAERVLGALAVTTARARVEAVIASTEAGSDGRLGVVFPDGSSVGEVDGDMNELELARESPSAFTVDTGDAIVLLAPVELQEGVAVIRVRVPASDVEQGVAAAWTILAGVAVGLLLTGVVIADRLAVSVTKPAVALADASRRVADGDLSVRVTPAGPPELERAARGFNDLAGRVNDLVATERQGVADLAHRLRTPLAAMQLDVEAVDDDAARARLAGDVTALEQAVDTVIHEARRPIRHAVSPVSDLARVVHDRVEFWSALAEEQARPWRSDIAPVGLPVAVPREELEAAVDALLDNVFTHTPPGTPFDVTACPHGAGRARLTVRDEGPGFQLRIPAAPSPPTLGRTGLGLDIATRAAEAGGGTLEVAHDGGAVVTLDLPLASSEDGVPPVERRRHRVAHQSAH